MESVHPILILLGAIFLAALVFDAVGRRTLLPRVTLLMLFGFAIGPSGTDLLPDITHAWFPAVANLALVMVGFLLGGGLTTSELRERGRQVVILSLVVVIATFAVISFGLLALGVPLIVAVLLGAIATATDPAATLDVVHQSESESEFSRTLLDIVAIDDAWGLIAFSVALAVGHLTLGAGPGEAVLHGLRDMGGALLLGCAIGVPMAALTGRIEPGEPTLYEALGGVLLCGGLALWLDVSFLLASMAMGSVVANLAKHHTRPFRAIEGIGWPFMIVFFVLAGASLEIESLWQAGGWLVAYLLLRVVGRVAGGWLAGELAGAQASTRRWLGLAMLPQAGVALGMALVAAQHFPEVGESILPVVVAATVIFEIVGPVATQVALQRTSRVRVSGA